MAARRNTSRRSTKSWPRIMRGSCLTRTRGLRCSQRSDRALRSKAHHDRRTYRRSRLGFAQILHLKVDEFPEIEMAGTVQGEQHAFDLVGFGGVVRERRHM